jgi:sec-independent protein translocase protein TatB
MSGIGFSELIILFLIGLIVLGPERLPRVANQLGNWIGQARRMTRVMKRQLEDELDLENTPDIKPPKPAATAFRDEKKTSDPAPVHLPANEDDDFYSASHDAGDVGTGIGDNEGVEAEDIPADDKDESSDKTGDSSGVETVKTP